MKGNLYTIFDVAAQEAGPPWSAKNDAVAVRQWQYLMAGDGGNKVSHPEDYHLYQIGSFDSESMILEANRVLIPTNVVIKPEGI